MGYQKDINNIIYYLPPQVYDILVFVQKANGRRSNC